ncbi:hypothetical protein VTI74DRAFT_7186 [Chaetomium olivicolor]
MISERVTLNIFAVRVILHRQCDYSHPPGSKFNLLQWLDSVTLASQARRGPAREGNDLSPSLSSLLVVRQCTTSLHLVYAPHICDDDIAGLEVNQTPSFPFESFILQQYSEAYPKCIAAQPHRHACGSSHRQCERTEPRSWGSQRCGIDVLKAP